MNKLQAHKRELEKQIRENEANLKSIEESIRKAEIEDRKNMSKELEEINEREVQQLLDKKKRLKRMFLEAIEEKKEQELKIKREEEFQRKSMKIYQDNKVQVDKTMKEKAKAEIEKKIRKLEIVGKRFRRIADMKQRANEKEDKKKGEADKEIEEKSKRELLELIEKNRQKKEKARLESLENMKKYEEQSKLRKKEEMDLKLWETLQRYKRDEFNREWNLQKLEEEKSKKMNYGKILKKQMEENDVKREKAAADADDSAIINEMINKENEKVLTFGERVLEESRGVRPIHLIVKTMEGLKKDMGLIPLTKAENSYEVSSVPKKKRGHRTFCNRPVNEENAFYFA
ncbi:trichoplein keratin filament-binding protein-like [Copidosoma floridanum]|uniref:trichoplein keratin filament-binding protein-like n=1 Tax=Copidosoma floridanum TaxID=29053 RepID=UPI0006C961C0|nr:trichoplein keratin filament-binding protein-like [Copidosoma floridanum]